MQNDVALHKIDQRARIHRRSTIRNAAAPRRNQPRCV